MVTNYVPEKGDLVWLNFDPQIGHEQKGCRPAICVSHKIYNQKIGLALFCPIGLFKSKQFFLSSPRRYAGIPPRPNLSFSHRQRGQKSALPTFC